MDAFFSLVATVSGSNIVLSWTLPVAGATAVQVQRASFGSTDWANIGASLAISTLTYTDSAPEAGDYSYRLAVTTTLGGVDKAGTLVYSNAVNASNLATTGVVVLSGSAGPGPQVAGATSRGYTRVSLTWTVDNSGVNDDTISDEVQRSLDGGVHWRHAGESDEFGPNAFAEEIPTGTGSVQYRVLVSLPNDNGQLRTPTISTSNVLTFTV